MTEATKDPLNAAIEAQAGGVVPGPAPDEHRAAAMEAYIQAGVEKAVAAAGNAEIVTVAAFRAALDALFRHLHLDHPENYLPKG